MPILALAATGTALFAGIKLLRSRFQPTNQFITSISQGGSKPNAATVDKLAATSVTETGFAAAPLATLRSLVADDEKRKVTVIMLTSASAWTHIALGMQIPFALLVLNGVGYIVLLTGHYFVPQLAPYRNQTRDALIAYTGTTIVGYFATCSIAGLIGPVGILNKLIEVGLIGALWFDPGSEVTAPANLIDSHEPSVQMLGEAALAPS